MPHSGFDSHAGMLIGIVIVPGTADVLSTLPAGLRSRFGYDTNLFGPRFLVRYSRYA